LIFFEKELVAGAFDIVFKCPEIDSAIMAGHGFFPVIKISEI